MGGLKNKVNNPLQNKKVSKSEKMRILMES